MTAKAAKRQSRKPVSRRGTQRGAVEQESRTCPVCGTKFFASADNGFCPVCILNKAFGPESAATGESGSVSGLAAASAEEANAGSQARRFDQYEVMLDEAGRPIELGRGAERHHNFSRSLVSRAIVQGIEDATKAGIRV